MKKEIKITAFVLLLLVFSMLISSSVLAQEEDRFGGTLNAAFQMSVAHLDSDNSTDSLITAMMNHVYEGLFEFDKNLNLTPHFKMNQFVTNQSNKFPQYIVLQESLLLKLEYFLEEVNKAGYKADTFGIVSIYRSPYFNKKLGNNTDFSRHLFGDAADIYIDNSGNQWMDDLNRDGKSTIKDSNILFDLAVKFDQKEEFAQLQGGVCSYKGNGVRGPFLHIDSRGFHVSW